MFEVSTGQDMECELEALEINPHGCTSPLYTGLWYCVALYGIMVLCGIVRHCMVLCGIVWYFVVCYGIEWCCMALCGIVWYWFKLF